MDNEILTKILEGQVLMFDELKTIGNRLDKLEHGQTEIIRKQNEDSKLLQAVFNKTVELVES